MRNAAQFWETVAIEDGAHCWEWRGSRDQAGYGRVHWNGRSTRAHRVAYELARSPIPEGLTIDHLCRNRGCVNPAHLEPVTLRENILRGNTFQAANAAKTHCPQGHPYSFVNSKGSRECQTCRNESNRRLRAAQGAKPRQRPTQCPQGHPYDEANTVIEQGRLRCRECKRNKLRRWRTANREVAACNA